MRLVLSKIQFSPPLHIRESSVSPKLPINDDSCVLVRLRQHITPEVSFSGRSQEVQRRSEERDEGDEEPEEDTTEEPRRQAEHRILQL